MTEARSAVTARKKLPLHWKMLIGFVVGLAARAGRALLRQAVLPPVWAQIEPAVTC